jgi:hypothetical protein
MLTLALVVMVHIVITIIALNTVNMVPKVSVAYSSHHISVAELVSLPPQKFGRPPRCIDRFQEMKNYSFRVASSSITFISDTSEVALRCSI